MAEAKPATLGWQLATYVILIIFFLLTGFTLTEISATLGRIEQRCSQGQK